MFEGKFYFDLTLCMGLCIAVFICTFSTIIFIYRKLEHETIRLPGKGEVVNLAMAAFNKLRKSVANPEFPRWGMPSSEELMKTYYLVAETA